MHQILAIALITLRNAIRSKIIWSLLLLLMMVIILLPISIRSDGTVAGLIQIVLSYTLGLAGFILALTTLWVGSAAFSTEVEDKTIQMVVTKPVSKFRIWCGKWLGINIMNAILLVISGLATYGMLQLHLQPARLTQPGQLEDAARILTARREIRPPYTHIENEANKRLTEQLQRNPLPAGFSREDALRIVRQQILIEQNSIPPGGNKHWNFGVVTLPSPEVSVSLQYKFSPSLFGQNVTDGQWLIGTAQHPELISIRKKSFPRTLNEINFTLDERWLNDPLVITYIDLDTSGASYIIDADRAMTILVPMGGFAANYMRALLIVFGQLAFLASLGVTVGCLFSLPVASFVSIFLLTIIQIGTYIQNVARTEIILPWKTVPPEEAMSWGTVIIAIIFKGMAFVLHPLVNESALENISTGRLIEYVWTFNGLIIQGFVYSLIMGWFASYVMNRRELALPST